MTNSKFNSELYQEMLDDNGIQYQNDIDSDMFNYMISDNDL